MRYVLGLLALVSAAVAGQIVTSETRCSSIHYFTGEVVRTQAHPTLCQFGDDATIGEVSSSLVANGNTIDGTAYARSTGNVGGLDAIYGTAYSTIRISDSFMTAGDQRTGVIRFWLQGAYVRELNVPFIKSYNHIDPNLPLYGEELITLGRNMPVLIGASASADGTMPPESWVGMVEIKLEFYEADGMTPVEVYSIPEPSTWGMVAAGFLAVLKIRQQHRT